MNTTQLILMHLNRRHLTMSNGRNHTMLMLTRNTSLRASIMGMCHTTKHRQSMSTAMSTMNTTMGTMNIAMSTMNTMNTTMSTMNSLMIHIMSIMQLRPKQLRLLY